MSQHLYEVVNYKSFAHKMPEEEFNQVRDVDPKKLDWIINSYLLLTPEEKKAFFANSKNITHDLTTWYKIANSGAYKRDGRIQSSDLRTELAMSKTPGKNPFEKLHNLLNNLSTNSSPITGEGKFTTLYQDGQWMLVEILDYTASVYFGRHKCNGSTCVSNPKDDHYYREYMGNNPNKPEGRLFVLRHLPFDEVGLSLYMNNKDPDEDDHCDLQDVYGKDGEDLWSIFLSNSNFTTDFVSSFSPKLIELLDYINRNKNDVKSFVLILKKTNDQIKQEIDSGSLLLSQVKNFIKYHPKFIRIFLENGGKYEDCILNTKTGKVDIKGNFIWKYNYSMKWVNFGEVSGDFDCHNTQITSLEGAPTSVGGNFYCANTKITSLEGAPTSVGDNFNCHNTKITSLEGAPTSVGGDFYCTNTQITSLEGAPTSVGGGFNCYNTQITSLEGAPTSVGGDFECANTQITSLEGAPTSVGRDFYCNNTNITSLKGAPTSVGGHFNCHNTNITSLEGAPTSVSGDFFCLNTKITSLEGAPTSVGGDFNCYNTKITSLEGAPTSVGGDFYCADTKITSLEGAPTSIGDGFNCTGCLNLKHNLVLRSRVGGKIYKDSDKIIKVVDPDSPHNNMLEWILRN